VRGREEFLFLNTGQSRAGAERIRFQVGMGGRGGEGSRS
jgi:hypothetical protein